MTRTKRLIALILAAMMALSIFAGCASKPAEVEEEPTTLVVGYSNFSEKFSPFFAASAYDQDVASMVSLGLLGTDREGNVILNGIEGETVPYNGTDYFYDGIADCVITQNADGTVDYSIKIRDDIKFSDGEALTIDDVIFSMYVLSDPTYDGSSTFYALPIEGMEAYRAGMEPKSNLIIAAGRDYVVSSSDLFTQAEYDQYWAAIDSAGVDFVNSIVEYCADYGATNVSEAMALWAYEGLPAEATAADAWAVIEEAYAGDIVTANATEAANVDLFDAANGYLGDDAANFAAGVQTGDTAARISGIVKVDDYSLNIKMTEFDAVAIYQLAIAVAPLHYYGDDALYDYSNNSFGFTKGDLSGVKAVTTTPLGAGAYKFVEYNNGIVTFEKNENYWKGCPIIDTIKFQETSDADKLTGVAAGTFDLSDPSISEAAVSSIKEYNGNDNLVGDVITTIAVDNLGYGYMGIQADNVKVGDDPASAESKALRKAFATLFAVYRDTVVNSYYGERASVIQYPISNTSWAAPKPADAGYQIAFSTDVEGNSIYTDSMTDQERFDAALQAAIGYLKAAGYTFDEEAGVFTAAPKGAEMVYEFIIPADGVGDHPVFGVVTAASADLAKIGIDLQVTDLSNSSILWDALEAGTVDMWAAAWGSTVDPDMYQVYHSSNVVGLGGTDSNHYHIADPELDEIILAARTSADQSYRKAAYKDCLDIILDWAVEVPAYQRQNAFIFSTERINIETLTPDITTYWGWMNDLEKVEMN
ncbi:MAG: ABC transporter substrate-binding protein [Clostridia bacterium]|nr:ABC transporter substrate-binding protein [Clostridia bacterium]